MDTTTSERQSIFRRSFSFVNSRNVLANKTSIVSALVLLLAWCGVVIFAVMQHEFWRDEVRALSLVRDVGSPIDLFRVIQGEGHPIVWYLLLYLGYSITHSQFVLPVMSILVAFVAVAIFIFYAPFQFWLKTIFIFSFPAYLYSVMARNYGISMLLLFIAAALYKHRRRHPLLFAIVLALLANTNAHSVIFAILILMIWVWDAISEHRTGLFLIHLKSLVLPFVIVIAGILLCALTTIPGKDTIVTDVYKPTTIPAIASTCVDAVFQPEKTFTIVAPTELSFSFASTLLFLLLLGMVPRVPIFLAALGAQIGFGLFFQIVYHGSYRHQGLFLVFMIFLYWLLREVPDDRLILKTKRSLINIGYFALSMLIVWNVAQTIIAIRSDSKNQLSSSKEFASFLSASQEYQNAIILPEPDYAIESLPYYAPNQIYFPREHRYGRTVSLSTKASARLTFGDLISAAREVRAESGRPVLIALGHWDGDDVDTIETRFSYNKIFTWIPEEYKVFQASTKLVANFTSSFSSENYTIYALK